MGITLKEFILIKRTVLNTKYNDIKNIITKGNKYVKKYVCNALLYPGELPCALMRTLCLSNGHVTRAESNAIEKTMHNKIYTAKHMESLLISNLSRCPSITCHTLAQMTHATPALPNVDI